MHEVVRTEQKASPAFLAELTSHAVIDLGCFSAQLRLRIEECADPSPFNLGIAHLLVFAAPPAMSLPSLALDRLRSR